MIMFAEEDEIKVTEKDMIANIIKRLNCLTYENNNRKISFKVGLSLHEIYFDENGNVVNFF